LYLTSNPSGFVNTSQAAAAAPVQSVNGATGSVSITAAGLSINTSHVSGLSDAATTSISTIQGGTTAANVGLGSVSNLSPANQVASGWNTTITAGSISLGNNTGARIVLDATSSAPRILIYDS
jgi:hypothetical protein